jgi:hypothetical protein
VTDRLPAGALGAAFSRAASDRRTDDRECLSHALSLDLLDLECAFDRFGGAPREMAIAGDEFPDGLDALLPTQAIVLAVGCSNMLEKDERATRSKHASNLRKRVLLIRHRTEKERRDDRVKGCVLERKLIDARDECLALHGSALLRAFA